MQQGNRPLGRGPRSRRQDGAQSRRRQELLTSTRLVATSFSSSIKKDVEKALRSYEKRKRDEALHEMQLVAEKHGIALKDVVQGGSKRSVQVPKYRRPGESALIWSGRGRQPAWFKAAMNAGRSRDDLLVT